MKSVVAVALFSTLTVLVGCSQGSSHARSIEMTGKSQPKLSSASGQGSVASPPSADVVLQGLFLATSAEFKSGYTSSWDQFSTRTLRLGVERCLLSNGFTKKQSESLLGTQDANQTQPRSNIYFPDFEALEKGTFADPNTPGKPSKGPYEAFKQTPEESALAATASKCGRQVIRKYEPVEHEVDKFENIWGDMIGNVLTKPTVVVALNRFKSCTGEQGVPITSVNDFFSLADRAAAADSQQKIYQLARIYATCYRPVSEAMDSYRLAARKILYDKYAPQLEQLAHDVQMAISELSRDYGLSDQPQSPR